MYTYRDPFSPVNNNFAMPVRRHLPFFLLRNYLNTDWFVPQDIKAAEPSRVFRRDVAERQTDTNYTTRRSKSFSIDLIPEGIRADIFHAARLAWKHFTFSSPEPFPGIYQYIGYDGDDKGYFYSHFDNGIILSNQLYINTPERCMTVIAYPNDDYEGGELQFDNILDSTGTPLKFKPQRGDVIAFPSHAVYTHQVLPVTRGVRYAITQFIDDPYYFRDFGPLSQNLVEGLRKELETGWWYGQQSLPGEGHNKYWNKHFTLASPSISAIWEALTRAHFAHGHFLEKVYANRQTFGQSGEAHRDTNYRSYTTLIYAVEDWRENWGGETLFYDSARKTILRSESPSPWKVIQFRGDNWHRAAGISNLATLPRTTLMFKSRSGYEIHPSEREAVRLSAGKESQPNSARK